MPSPNPTITSLETWRCQRHEALFDSARTGRSPMNWDVVVLRLNTDAGITGHATAVAARSSIVTQAYLHETIAPVVLGRHVSEREAIWHELWTIDRHLTFFPFIFPGRSMWRCGISHHRPLDCRCISSSAN